MRGLPRRRGVAGAPCNTRLERLELLGLIRFVQRGGGLLRGRKGARIGRPHRLQIIRSRPLSAAEAAAAGEDWALVLRLAALLDVDVNEPGNEAWRNNGVRYLQDWRAQEFSDAEILTAAKKCAANMRRTRKRGRAFSPGYIEQWLKPARPEPAAGRGHKGPIAETATPWADGAAVIAVPANYAAAIKAGLDSQAMALEAAKFVADAAAKGKRRADWAAAWSKWCLDAAAHRARADQRDAEALRRGWFRWGRSKAAPSPEPPPRDSAPPPTREPDPPPKTLTDDQRAAARAEGEEIIARLTGRRRP